MCDVVVNLEVTSEKEDELLLSTVQTFITGQTEDDTPLDAPRLMLRPAILPSGKLGKALVFQDRNWADAFMLFWEERKMQAAIG